MKLPFLRLYNDIGIDLGTANTLVYVKGLGIVINEPSVIAVNKKTNRVLQVGKDARAMMGRNPGHIEIIRPILDGVISDYEITEEMLTYFINKGNNIKPSILRPRVVVGVPVNITHVEMQAVFDASKGAGAREVYIVEEPMLAAIGAKLPVSSPKGTMIIDIGGGTTDIAVISLSGVVVAKSLKVAGDALNQDVLEYLRRRFKLNVGIRTAEEVKIEIGRAYPLKDQTSVLVKGRDVGEGVPKEVIVTGEDMRLAMGASLAQIADKTRDVIESTPPEILSDIINNGIYLSGGGALIPGIDKFIEDSVGIKCIIIDEPLTAVARGASYILEDLEKFNDVLIESVDELSIT